jgi:2,3-bisphosphoglycerate-independent phosphoglycerate mutase
VLNEAIDFATGNGGRVHLFGIVSDAGVHGLLEHLYACLELCKRRGLGRDVSPGGGDRVFLHAFTDGRDTSPNSGPRVPAAGRGADAGGRRRPGRDRVRPVLGHGPRQPLAAGREGVPAIALGEGPRFHSAEDAVKHYYANPTEPNMAGDEFVTPSVITGGHATGSAAADRPLAVVRDGDAVIFYNYRGDRPRELTKAFVPGSVPGRRRRHPARVRPRAEAEPLLRDHDRVRVGLPVKVAYPKAPKMTNILGEYVANLGMRQFRCAETEKFPHVTFFFNDYRNDPFPGEDRQIVPSPTDVSTYDQRPEMSAYGIADEVVRRVDSGLYDLVVVNFANGDMVGHTGVLDAAVKAVEHVDVCVGRVLAAVQRQGGCAIVTADHGNAEQMIDPSTGGPHTAHTTYPVELVVMDDRMRGKKLYEGGKLADVAPTLLHLLGLAKPAEMSGRSLLVEQG